MLALDWRAIPSQPFRGYSPVGWLSAKYSQLEWQIIVVAFLFVLSRVLLCGGLITRAAIVRATCGLILRLSGFHRCTLQLEVIHLHFIVVATIVLASAVTESHLHDGTFYQLWHDVGIECFQIHLIVPRVGVVLLILNNKTLSLPLIACAFAHPSSRLANLNNLTNKFHLLNILMI